MERKGNTFFQNQKTFVENLWKNNRPRRFDDPIDVQPAADRRFAKWRIFDHEPRWFCFNH